MSVPNSCFTVPGSGHAFVRKVRSRWRSLTGGSAVRDPERRTLVACSGGADSAALVLALSDRPVEVAHIVHDLRPEAESLADRDAVRVLAKALGLPFHESAIRVRKDAGNVESNARRARYQALEHIAGDRGIAFVATAHHAEDQLETLLLRLARGAGVRGMRGIAPRRSLGTVCVVRPLLESTRVEARAFCNACGYAWREDATNADLSRARANIRHTVIPALVEAQPQVLRGAMRTVRQMRLASGVIDAEAKRVHAMAVRTAHGYAWDRVRLAGEPVVVIGAALLVASNDILGDRHADARGSDTVLAVSHAIRDRSARLVRFDWRGIVVHITEDTVTLERTDL